jgi:uncharacterized protein YqgQ
MKSKIKQFKKDPLELTKQISDEYEKSLKEEDSEFFYDRVKWTRDTMDVDEYRSTSEDDKRMVLNTDIRSVVILLNQLLRFGRFVYTNNKDEITNFPKKEIPKFYLNYLLNKKTNTIKENLNRRRRKKYD